MKLDRYPGGETVTAAGVTHGEPWRFALPVLRFAMAVTLGDARYELPLTVDTLCLFPDYRRFFVLARRACVYQILPGRRRAISLYAGEATGGAPVSTIAAQRAAAAPLVPIVPAAAPEALPLPFDSLLVLYPLTRIVEELPLCASG